MSWRPALSILLLALALPASAAQEKGAALPFGPGEELIYRVTALGMTAGRARIAVGLPEKRGEVEAWPVVVQARTDSFFDSIYRVRDRFVTWWSPADGRVLGAEFHADEGGERRRSRTRLDHARGVAEVERQRAGERSRATYAIPAGAYDIAGAIFALRRTPLAPGTVEELDVFTGRKVFRLRCTAVGVETVQTGAGSFEAIATRIELGFDGPFASKRDVRAWFSNDARRIPLRFEAELALGTLVADLLERPGALRP